MTEETAQLEAHAQAVLTAYEQGISDLDQYGPGAAGTVGASGDGSGASGGSDEPGSTPDASASRPDTDGGSRPDGDRSSGAPDTDGSGGQGGVPVWPGAADGSSSRPDLDGPVSKPDTDGSSSHTDADGLSGRAEGDTPGTSSHDDGASRPDDGVAQQLPDSNGGVDGGRADADGEALSDPLPRNDTGNSGDSSTWPILRDGEHVNADGSLKPNVRYEAGEFEYIFTTDENGYISSFHAGELHLTERDSRLRHDPNTPGKLDSDHAGHIAGDRFGGSEKLDNLVSQLRTVNLSAYKKLENVWARALDPNQPAGQRMFPLTCK